MTEVLEWLQANHPELHAVAEIDRDWCWLVCDLRGDHNKATRESLKKPGGFIFHRHGGHLLPSGKLGMWGHSTTAPLPFFRKSKGKSTSHPTSETTTDQQPDAALAAALAFATAA